MRRHEPGGSGGSPAASRGPGRQTLAQPTCASGRWRDAGRAVPAFELLSRTFGFPCGFLATSWATLIAATIEGNFWPMRVRLLGNAVGAVRFRPASLPICGLLRRKM